jgi:hypothetical protein
MNCCQTYGIFGIFYEAEQHSPGFQVKNLLCNKGGKELSFLPANFALLCFSKYLKHEKNSPSPRFNSRLHAAGFGAAFPRNRH